MLRRIKRASWHDHIRAGHGMHCIQTYCCVNPSTVTSFFPLAGHVCCTTGNSTMYCVTVHCPLTRMTASWHMTDIVCICSCIYIHMFTVTSAHWFCHRYVDLGELRKSRQGLDGQHAIDIKYGIICIS